MPSKETQLNQWVSPLYVREEELKQFDLGLGKKPPGQAREIMHRHIFWTQVNVDDKIKMCLMYPLRTTVQSVLYTTW